MHLNRNRVVAAWLSMLLMLLAVANSQEVATPNDRDEGAGILNPFPKEFDQNRASFSSSRWTSNGWVQETGIEKPLSSAPQPPIDVLLDLRVEWTEIKIDSLGHQLILIGHLNVTKEKDDSVRIPISWRQGITVALSKAPEIDLERDWSKDNVAEKHCELTQPDGSIKAVFDLKKLNRNPDESQTFCFVIALATHIDRTEKAFGPIIRWTSSDPLLDTEPSFITIPPNPKVDPILGSINQARYESSQDYNPASILIAVNALQPLGKEKALSALQSYLDALSQDEPYDDDATNHIFVILRLLFEPYEHGKRFPVPGNFEWRVFREELQQDWPLNPVELVDGIPFKLFGGGMGFSGQPEHPSSHIEFAKKHCVILSEPLIPKINPLVAAEQIIESQKMGRLRESDREGSIRSIRQQALSMMPQEWGKIDEGYEENKAVWEEARERSLREKIKWIHGQGFRPSKSD